MVGLVVVSHSRSLARAAVALAGEMVHGRDVRIEIAAEASAALAGKQSHFGPPAPAADPGGAPADEVGVLTVINRHGLHARPAAKFVTEVRAFDARVDVRNLTTGSAWVPAASLS